MGSGKTSQTIDYLINKQSFIWMTPIVALADNTKFRLDTAKIICNHYKEFKGGPEVKKIKMPKCDKLIICINSIFYTGTKKYKVVVIDEIETFLIKLFNNDTFKNGTKLLCWTRLLQIIRDAEKVILLDAFTSKITINFIKNLKCGNLKIYEKISEKSDRKVYFMANYDNWLYEIIEQLKLNKKPFIFYPYLSQHRGFPSMEELKLKIQQETNKIGVCYNSQVCDADLDGLKNVNATWSKYDFVITNTKITVGINYELNDFDTVYLSIAGFSSTRDIIQVSYRCRNIKSNNIKVCYIEQENTNKCYENDDEPVNYCNIYKNLVHDILEEKNAPLKSSFLYFCNMAHYTIKADKNVLNKELSSYISKLFSETNIGYSYETIPFITKTEMREIEQKIYKQEATLDEKLMMQKYYFRLRFKLTPFMNNHFTINRKKEDMITYNKHIEKRDIINETIIKNNLIQINNNKFFDKNIKIMKLIKSKINNILIQYSPIQKTINTINNIKVIKYKYINKKIIIRDAKNNEFELFTNYKDKKIFINSNKRKKGGYRGNELQIINNQIINSDLTLFINDNDKKINDNDKKINKKINIFKTIKPIKPNKPNNYIKLKKLKIKKELSEKNEILLCTIIPDEIIKDDLYKDGILLDDEYTKGQLENIQYENDMLKVAWDHRYNYFFDKLSLFPYNDNVGIEFLIFDEIKKFNKWPSIFPSNDDLNKVKLNDELLEEIFKKFHFVNLHIKSNAKLIIRYIYNSFFGKNIISVEIDNKNATYIISDTVRIMYEFGLEYLKIFNKNEYISNEPNTGEYADEFVYSKGNVNIFDDDDNADELVSIKGNINIFNNNNNNNNNNSENITMD